MKANKEQIYKQIKVAGIAASIPFVLAAGPLAGQFAGEYLRNRFKLGPSVTIICVTVGFIAAIVETVRLIKFISKMDNR